MTAAEFPVVGGVARNDRGGTGVGAVMKRFLSVAAVVLAACSGAVGDSTPAGPGDPAATTDSNQWSSGRSRRWHPG